jgi:hypothetical protein
VRSTMKGHSRLTNRNNVLLFGLFSGIGVCLGMLTCFLFSVGKNDVDLFTPPVVHEKIQLPPMLPVHHHPPVSLYPNESAAICTIAVDEEAYIDEWVDYHYALGFTAFYIYDNSPANELRQWATHKGPHVVLKHFPEKAAQLKHLTECGNTYGVANNHTWLAYYDIDEFLVLRKHRHVVDFLHEYAKEGALAINWLLFFNSGRVHYEPLPVTKRFFYREAMANNYTKLIVRLDDLNVEIQFHSPHIVPLKEGKLTIDTNGHVNKIHLNYNGPTDIASLHHYHTKSRKEFIRKKMRGDVYHEGREMNRTHAEALADEFLLASDLNTTIFDDSAWQLMKEIAPKYRVFDMYE